MVDLSASLVMIPQPFEQKTLVDLILNEIKKLYDEKDAVLRQITSEQQHLND